MVGDGIRGRFRQLAPDQGGRDDFPRSLHRRAFPPTTAPAQRAQPCLPARIGAKLAGLTAIRKGFIFWSMKIVIAKKLLRAVLLGLWLSLLPWQSQAAYDMYISINDITGSAAGGLIPITSFQWGVGRGIGAPTAGSRQVSSPSFSELTINKPMDSSSPKLAMQAAGGGGTNTCVLTVKDHNSGNTLYTLTLKNVYISSYSLSSGGNVPSESLSLNYTQITWVYQKLDNSGATLGTPSLPLGWDLTTNQPL